MMMNPSQLTDSWHERAELFRSHGKEGVARAYEHAAQDLERAHERQADELLNLQQAAEYSGYSADYLGRMVREGKIPNAGRENAPRIRKSDLWPDWIKAGRLPSTASTEYPTEAQPEQIAEAIVAQG